MLNLPPSLKPYWSEIKNALNEGDETRALYAFIYTVNKYRNDGIETACKKMEGHIDFYLSEVATQIQNSYLSIAKSCRESKINYSTTPKYNERLAQLKLISEKNKKGEKPNIFSQTTASIAFRLGQLVSTD